jgi:DNA-binding transcriptional ArsR family regulator
MATASPNGKAHARDALIRGEPGRAGQRLAKAEQGAAFLTLLGDPVRLQMILALAAKEQAIDPLCEALVQDRPAVDDHLRFLRQYGLVTARRQAGDRTYALTALGEGLARAIRALLD